MIKAAGTFTREGKYIFRTEAKIQWGQKEAPLGMIIMLNPGSSLLINSTKWDKLIRGVANVDSGEIRIDDTMQVVIDILELAIPKIDGILQIYNLFDFRLSKSDDALDLYKKLKVENIKALERNFSIDFINQFPWVWIAWGVEDQKEINARKREIKKLMQLSGKPRFGIYTRQEKFIRSDPRIHYYHPLQRGIFKRNYKEAMVAQFKSFFETGCTNFLD